MCCLRAGCYHQILSSYLISSYVKEIYSAAIDFGLRISHIIVEKRIKSTEVNVSTKGIREDIILLGRHIK